MCNTQGKISSWQLIGEFLWAEISFKRESDEPTGRS